MNRGAIFTEGKRHRSLLIRDWDIGNDKPMMAAIMLNPSKADSEHDDPTTTFMINIAKREGCGSYRAVNLHDYVGTDPEEMKTALDPVSDFNDYYIKTTVSMADIVIVAWGTHGNFMGRADHVMNLFQNMKNQFYCFGVNNDGSPRFPRALRKDAELVRYNHNV
jgi:hypothetical protein